MNRILKRILMVVVGFVLAGLSSYLKINPQVTSMYMADNGFPKTSKR